MLSFLFSFLFSPALTGNLLLIAAAVVPAAFLLVKVYRSDRLEKESLPFLLRLLLLGVLSAGVALVLEMIGGFLLGLLVPEDSVLYPLITYFLIVGLSEESAKYLMLRLKTWHSPEFNCQYDGVVYATFVSLGFALIENVLYVVQNGFGTAVMRAVTAIPGHACFGVFMGVLYGLARSYFYLADMKTSKLFRVLAVAVPTLLHGAYDYIATSGVTGSTLIFLLFIAAFFALSLFLINRMARNDHYFTIDRRHFPL